MDWTRKVKPIRRITEINIAQQLPHAFVCGPGIGLEGGQFDGMKPR